MAGINLQHGLLAHRAEQVKTLEVEDGRVELRAVTGPDYGRIYDHELVDAVRRIAGNGTGDTRWKVPGVLDWSTGIYNPCVDITKDTTTLYAPGRDVFLFLVGGWLPERGPSRPTPPARRRRRRTAKRPWPTEMTSPRLRSPKRSLPRSLPNNSPGQGRAHRTGPAEQR